MNWLFNGRLKYLFLVPIILLIGFALFYQNAFMGIQGQILIENMTDTAFAAQFNGLVTGIIIQSIITFLINMAFVALLCYLGVVYKSRKGPKWRAPL